MMLPEQLVLLGLKAEPVCMTEDLSHYSPLGGNDQYLFSMSGLGLSGKGPFLGEEVPCTGKETCKATVGKKERPSHCLCLQAAHGRSALPARPTLNPPWLIQLSMKTSQTKVCL